MTNPSTLPEPLPGFPEPIDLTLHYGKKPIRVRIEAGTAWFAATDIYAALRLYTDRSLLATFDINHLALISFEAPSGRISLSAVSPLGVATIAKTLVHPMGRILASWVRKHANHLAEEHGLRRLEMALLADGTLPPKPRVLDEDYQPWLELERRNPILYKLAPDFGDPALLDEDTNLPPVRPADRPGPLSAILAARASA